MDTDDLEPVRKAPAKKDLSRMSVGDLQDYIAELGQRQVATGGEAECQQR